MVSSKQNDTNIDDKEQESQKGDIKARRESKLTRKKRQKKARNDAAPGRKRSRKRGAETMDSFEVLLPKDKSTNRAE